MIDIRHLLSQELGADTLVSGERAQTEYARDESPLSKRTLFPPDAVVVCKSPEQVTTVLRLAKEHNIPVTPRGAGSGKCGGCLATQGGIVLSTEGMTSILEIDDKDLVCVVEPGVITGELQTAVRQQGLFYPPDPASLAYCSIGGNVATNAGGPRAFQYGVTRNYVLGMDVALMGGELLTVGRRTTKGVTGYDLVGGFVGSEGTFGVHTKLTLRLLPAPPHVETLLAVFPSMNAAAKAVTKLLPYRPRVLEFADHHCIQAVRDDLPFSLSASDKAFLLVEIDGFPQAVSQLVSSVASQCEQADARELWAANDVATTDRLWKARRGISHALTAKYAHRVSEDICVPLGKIESMLEEIEALGNKHGIQTASFGHAGDGNIHVSLLFESIPTEDFLTTCVSDLFQRTIALGGTLSGEHGIGLTKRDFLPLEQSERVIHWQRQWKQMWDPNCLLNPGKIFPGGNRICHE